MTTRRLWAALPLLLSGCFLLDITEPLAATSTSEWITVGKVDKPLTELNEITRNLMIKQGYPVPETPPDSQRLLSDWNVQLSSHWREGVRTRLEADFQPYADGSCEIQVRSYLEINDEPKHPMILDKARWMGASLDAKHAPKMSEPALRLQQMLKLKLFGMAHDQ